MTKDPQENGDVPVDDELSDEMLGVVSGGNGYDDILPPCAT